jgi:hypothetical protein
MLIAVYLLVFLLIERVGMCKSRTMLCMLLGIQETESTFMDDKTSNPLGHLTTYMPRSIPADDTAHPSGLRLRNCASFVIARQVGFPLDRGQHGRHRTILNVDCVVKV